MNQNILGFDITMNDISFLQKLQGYDNLSNKSSYNLIWKSLFVFSDKVFESALIAIFNE